MAHRAQLNSNSMVSLDSIMLAFRIILPIIISFLTVRVSPIKYYYEDNDRTLRLFTLPEDEYNLWVEMKPSLQMKSLPLNAIDLDCSGLSDVSGFSVDDMVLLFARNKTYLLKPSPKSSNILRVDKILTDPWNRDQLMPFSSESFLANPSLNLTTLRSNSLGPKFVNFIEQHHITSSKSPDFELKDAIKFTLDAVQSLKNWQIVDEVITEEYVFLLIKLVFLGEKSTRFILGRLCEGFDLKPLTAILLHDDSASRRRPTHLSAAVMAQGLAVMIIGYADPSTDYLGSLEIYQLDQIHQALDQIAIQCLRGSTSVFHFMDIISGKRSSSCSTESIEYKRCSHGKNYYILGPAQSLDQPKLRFELTKRILDIHSISTQLPFRHIIIIILTESSIEKCGLTLNWILKCNNLNIQALGQPQPFIKFIHATGNIQFELGDSRESYSMKLFRCSCFTDCYSCQTFGYHYSCGWSDSQCRDAGPTRPQCFNVVRVNQVSNKTAEFEIHLAGEIGLTDSLYQPFVLAEDTSCQVTSFTGSQIKCRIANPSSEKLQLTVNIEPKLRVKPARTLSAVSQLVEINCKDCIKKPAVKTPWKLIITIGILCTAGLTIGYIVHQIAI